MKGKDFTGPLGDVAIALRGKFDKPFVKLLWSKYGKLEAGVWADACRLVSLIRKSSQFIVLRDFSDKVLEAVNRREEKDRRERRREERSSSAKGKVVSMKTLCNLAIRYGPWWMKKDAAQRLEKMQHEETKSRKMGASS